MGKVAFLLAKMTDEAKTTGIEYVYFLRIIFLRFESNE
jgi:hypothetical protein